MAQYLIQTAGNPAVTVSADDYHFDLEGNLLIFTNSDSENRPVAIVSTTSLDYVAKLPLVVD